MPTFSEIAHRNHRILSPLLPEKVDRVLALLDLEPGARVLDAGCGKAEMLIRVVERYRATGVGIDVSSVFLDQARQEVERRVPPGTVELRHGPIADFHPADGSLDLALCVGATHILGGYRPALDALRRWVRPGGQLLVGEGYWKREPERSYLEVLDAKPEDYTSHAGNLCAATEAGLIPLYSATSSDDEWDHYEGLYARSIELYASQHPRDTEVPAMLKRIRRWRDAYMRWGRETLGFGLYLLRAP